VNLAPDDRGLSAGSPLLLPLHFDKSNDNIFLSGMAGERIDLPQGSLYPALHRLERRGWIKARWGSSENNRRAKFYELTRSGRKQLDVEADAWRRLTAAVALVLDKV
jgi:DNA-binding PadR family transcriptional regulator